MGTLEQITKLIDAGYTKDEIAALFAQEAKEQAPADPKPTEQPQAQPAQQAQPQTQPQQAPADQQPTGFEKLDAAINKMNELADGIAKLAIMNSQQPARESTNDFLAKIINPHYGEDK